MSTDRRAALEDAFLLHQRPFRDSSQILDVFSRERGRLALVARGSRGAKSRLKGILRPFQPLRLSWSIRTDLGTLTGAETGGRAFALAGDALLSGYYVNELLLNFLHRHDPQPEIFALYGAALEDLATCTDPAPELRRFEIELLRLLGYALDLEYDARSGELLEDAQDYEYRVEEGPVPVTGNATRDAYSGSRLKAIAAGSFEDSATLRAANRLLRRVVNYHLGGKELKSRKVLIELYRDRIRGPEAGVRPDTDT